jgi:hypothetical protein
MLRTAATKLFASAGSGSPAAPALLQGVRRGILGGADHNKSEPTAR